MMEVEKSYDTAVKEKQRVQLLLESVQRRADDLERTLETTNQKVEELKLIENNVNDINSKCLDLESRLTMTEKEKDIAQRDIHKYREMIEVFEYKLLIVDMNIIINICVMYTRYFRKKT